MFFPATYFIVEGFIRKPSPKVRHCMIDKLYTIFPWFSFKLLWILEKRVAKNVPKQKINELMQKISTQIEINSIVCRVESLANQKYSNVPTIFNIRKTGDHLISLLLKAIDDIDKGFLYTIK